MVNDLNPRSSIMKRAKCRSEVFVSSDLWKVKALFWFGGNSEIESGKRKLVRFNVIQDWAVIENNNRFSLRDKFSVTMVTLLFTPTCCVVAKERNAPFVGCPEVSIYRRNENRHRSICSILRGSALLPDVIIAAATNKSVTFPMKRLLVIDFHSPFIHSLDSKFNITKNQ